MSTVESRQSKIDRELLGLLKRVSESLGSFCSDEGWDQKDMETMDSVDAEICRLSRKTEAKK